MKMWLEFQLDKNGLYYLALSWRSYFYYQTFAQNEPIQKIFMPALPNSFELVEEINFYYPQEIIILQNEDSSEAISKRFMTFLQQQLPKVNINLLSVNEIEDSIAAKAQEGFSFHFDFYSSGFCPAGFYPQLGLRWDFVLSKGDTHLYNNTTQLQQEIEFLKQELSLTREWQIKVSSPEAMSKDLENLISEHADALKVLYKTQESKSYQALWNGTTAFFNGLYPPCEPSQSPIKHVYLPSAEQTVQTYQKLGSFVEGNHNLFLEAKELEANTDLLFSPEVLGQYVPSNQMELKIPGSAHEHGCMVLNRRERKDFCLQAYCNYQSTDIEHSYTALYDSLDFEAFKQDYQVLSTTGQIPHIRMCQPDMVDQCRFWMVEQCAADHFLRMRVDHQHIYPCLTSPYRIGCLDDAPAKLLFQLKREKLNLKKERKCQSCAANANCSKCLALPDGVSAEEYCAFMQDPMHYSYLRGAVLATRLLQTMQVLPDLNNNLDKLCVFTYESNLLLDRPANGINQLPHYVYLFRYNVQDNADNIEEATKNIIFSLASRKALAINDTFLYLTEWIARDYPIDALNMSAIPGDKAETEVSVLYHQAFSVLKKYKFIETGE